MDVPLFETVDFHEGENYDDGQFIHKVVTVRKDKRAGSRIVGQRLACAETPWTYLSLTRKSITKEPVTCLGCIASV